VIVNLDALVTAREAQDYPPLQKAGVCRHTIGTWRTLGWIAPVDKVGRSPRYRWRDVLRVEHAKRSSGRAHRSTRCRSCDRAAERERQLVAA
jgi:hypothetical protein